MRNNSAFQLGGSIVHSGYELQTKGAKSELGSEEVEVLPFSSNKLADLLTCFEKPHLLSSFAGPLEVPYDLQA